MNTLPKVSVIIPCFNHGKYIDECVNSVLNQTFKDLEIIIVNDGSTDKYTNNYLSNYVKENTTVLSTTNQGLPSARNNGIKISKGKYILPLDADDKIHPKYLEKAVNIIEKNNNSNNIGIVYPKTEFFEGKTGVWDLPKYSFPDELLKNTIVCASLFKKEDWEKVGGYNSNMIYGYEDMDFWLSILELNKEVRAIPEVMFYYRQKITTLPQAHSILDANSSIDKVLYTFSTLVKNHPKLYADNAMFLVNAFNKMEFEKEDIRKLVVQRDHLIIDLQNETQRLMEERKYFEYELYKINTSYTYKLVTKLNSFSIMRLSLLRKIARILSNRFINTL